MNVRTSDRTGEKLFYCNLRSCRSRTCECSGCSCYFYCLVLYIRSRLDVRASVRNSKIHIGNATRCNSISKFYFIFIWNSTCFGRHTAHHQEPKIALAASGFAYLEGCWTCSCWTLSSRDYSAWRRPTTTCPTTFHGIMQNQKLLLQF